MVQTEGSYGPQNDTGDDMVKEMFSSIYTVVAIYDKC